VRIIGNEGIADGADEAVAGFRQAKGACLQRIVLIALHADVRERPEHIQEEVLRALVLDLAGALHVEDIDDGAHFLQYMINR